MFVALGGGASGLRAPHTRALGLVQLVLAFGAVCRFLGWCVGTALADSLQAYKIARTFSTAGVVAEGAAQALVVAWLSTRRRWSSSR